MFEVEQTECIVVTITLPKAFMMPGAQAASIVFEVLAHSCNEVGEMIAGTMDLSGEHPKLHFACSKRGAPFFAVEVQDSLDTLARMIRAGKVDIDE